MADTEVWLRRLRLAASQERDRAARHADAVRRRNEALIRAHGDPETKGLTMNALAEAAGLSRQMVRRILAGDGS